MKELETPFKTESHLVTACKLLPTTPIRLLLWLLSFLRSEFNFVTARSYWCGSFRFWLDQHDDCFCSCHFHSIEMIREDFVEDPSVRRSWVQILQRSCFQPLFGIVAPAPCARVTREHRNVRLRLGLGGGAGHGPAAAPARDGPGRIRTSESSAEPGREDTQCFDTSAEWS